MSSVSKRAAKESEKKVPAMEMAPTTRMKLDYENAYARMTVYREFDRSKPAEIKFTPAQVLPFCQQEGVFWDQFDQETFDSKCNLVRQL